VRLADVAAACLTHLDSDHFNMNWIPTLIRQNIRLFCHANKAREILGNITEHLATELEPLLCHSPTAIRSTRSMVFAFIHFHWHTIWQARHGFVIHGFDYRIGYATDLGHVPAHLHEHFYDLDLIALESNYDPAMQEQSDRPWFLKRRITGGKGHLSNRQALTAIQKILDCAQANCRRLPDHIVLLHRSRQCNCPELLRAALQQGPAHRPSADAGRAIRTHTVAAAKRASTPLPANN